MKKLDLAAVVDRARREELEVACKAYGICEDEDQLEKQTSRIYEAVDKIVSKLHDDNPDFQFSRSEMADDPNVAIIIGHEENDSWYNDCHAGTLANELYGINFDSFEIDDNYSADNPVYKWFHDEFNDALATREAESKLLRECGD